MCLSSVYEVRDGKEELICEHVSSVVTDKDGVILTDIMGEEIIVPGALKSIDLVKNIILIGAAK